MSRLALLVVALLASFAARAAYPVDAAAFTEDARNRAAVVPQRGLWSPEDLALPASLDPEIEQVLATREADPPPRANVAPPPAAVVEPEPRAAVRAEREPRRARFEQFTLAGKRPRSGVLGAFLVADGAYTTYGAAGVGAWGLGGGLVLGGHVVLGAAAYSTGALEIGATPTRFAYAGVQPGLIFGTAGLLHPRVDVLLGRGVALDTRHGELIGAAFVAVPRIGLELNLTRAVRLSANLAYRVVGAPRSVDGTLSGLEGGVALRVGWH